MPTFGDRVKALRKERGLTQRQMAETLSITERNYQRYEATESPSNETLTKLANFFDVSTDYLLGRSMKRFTVEDVEKGEHQKNSYFMPKFLFEDDRFTKLSIDAKFLYMLLLDSYGNNENVSNDKTNKGVNVPIDFYSEDINEKLGLTSKQVQVAFEELRSVGLIEE